MNQKIIIVGIVVIVIVALGWFFFSTNQTKTEETAATTQNEVPTATSSADTSSENTESQASGSGSTITYTDSGFSPASLTVKSGESITWVNDSSSSVQVGSAIHPTHTVNQEITNNQFYVELAPGESAKVQLTKTGEWGYHDHLRPSMTGTITVN